MLTLIAWALFAGDVHQLGSDDCAARELAEARLQAWAWAARPVLRWPFADPERQRRARRILSRHEGRANPPGGVWPCVGVLAEDVLIYRCWNEGFWPRPRRDCYYQDPRTLREAVARHYSVRVNRDDAEYEAAARLATSLLFGDLARLGVPLSWRQRLADWMARRERELLAPERPEGAGPCARTWTPPTSSCSAACCAACCASAGWCSWGDSRVAMPGIC